MISYTRTHLVVLLCTVLQSSLTYGSRECSPNCANCFGGICLECVEGHYGMDCDLPCAVHCSASACRDQRCYFGCAVGWYGRNCNIKCAHCPNGCFRIEGTCIKSKKDEADEDNDDDYSSKKIPNKFETAIKACAAIVSIAVVLFVVAICCRRKEESHEDNDNHDVGADRNDDVDDDLSSDNSSSYRIRSNRTPSTPVLDNLTGYYVDTSSREDHSALAEPSTPMLDNRDDGEPQTPPTAPPPSAPSVPPAAPMEVPPPSYSSLFPENVNRTVNPS